MKLSAHVAGLAKTHQIIGVIGGISTIEFAEGAYVVYGNRLSDEDVTRLACSFISFDHKESKASPVASAVRFRTAHPVRRIWARFMDRAIFASALGRAKLICSSPLPCEPRLYIERLATMNAGEFKRFNPGGIAASSYCVGSKPRRIISSWLANTVKAFGIVYPKALLGAILPAPPLRLVWGYVSFLAADSTRAYYAHDNIIPLFMGSGTTAWATRRLGRKSVGFDLDARNVELIRERLGPQGVLL